MPPHPPGPIIITVGGDVITTVRLLFVIVIFTTAHDEFISPSLTTNVKLSDPLYPSAGVYSKAHVELIENVP